MTRAALICVLLAGCASEPAVPPVPKPVAAVTCLPLATYSPAQETALGGALAALDPANPIVSAMGDYGAMRAADRACLGLVQQ